MAARSAAPPQVPFTRSASANDFSGVWNITTAKTFQGQSYRGKVQIKPVGQAYQVKWDLGNSRYQGVGLANGQHLFVGWAPDLRCGIVVYEIKKDRLVGIWTDATAKGLLGSEEIKTNGKLVGVHHVTGTNANKRRYKATVAVKKMGDVYHFQWKSGSMSYQGSGRKRGNLLAIGWGFGAQYGYVEYEQKREKLLVKSGFTG